MTGVSASRQDSRCEHIEEPVTCVRMKDMMYIEEPPHVPMASEEEGWISDGGRSVTPGEPRDDMIV